MIGILDTLNSILETLGHFRWPLDCIVKTWGTAWWYSVLKVVSECAKWNFHYSRSTVLPEGRVPDLGAMAARIHPKLKVK